MTITKGIKYKFSSTKEALHAYKAPTDHGATTFGTQIIDNLTNREKTCIMQAA